MLDIDNKMITYEFNYQNRIFSNYSSEETAIGEIFKTFCAKENIDINSIYFLYNGNKINATLKFNEIANSFDKERKKMNILAMDVGSETDENNIKEVKQVICPICKEDCRLQFENYKVKLFDCINNHSKNIILLNEYKITTNIDQSKIKCDVCKENDKGKTYNNSFFKCLNCKINVCPMCKSNHNKDHNIINYDDKNYICDKHNELFNSYCYDCQKNLCIFCEKEHNNH